MQNDWCSALSSVTDLPKVQCLGRFSCGLRLLLVVALVGTLLAAVQVFSSLYKNQHPMTKMQLYIPYFQVPGCLFKSSAKRIGARWKWGECILETTNLNWFRLFSPQTEEFKTCPAGFLYILALSMTIKEVPAGEIVLTEREYQDGKCALVSMQLDDLY